MKVQFRLVTGEIYNIELPQNSTIGDFRELLNKKLKRESHEYNLLYQGLVLKDDKKLSDLNILLNKFIVVHIKSKRFLDPTEEQNNLLTQSQNPVYEQSLPNVNAIERQNSLNTIPKYKDPENFNDLVENLSYMGFEKAKIENALRKSKYDADEAVEFLISSTDAQSPSKPVQTEPIYVPTKIEATSLKSSNNMHGILTDQEYKSLKAILPKDFDENEAINLFIDVGKDLATFRSLIS